jgi:hypothetical protein
MFFLRPKTKTLAATPEKASMNHAMLSFHIQKLLRIWLQGCQSFIGP